MLRSPSSVALRRLLTLTVILPLGLADISGDEVKDVPANTWVKVLEAKTGGREQPVFVYAAQDPRFVVGGRHAELRRRRAAPLRHRGVRPGPGKWFNAYPPGVAKGRPASGPAG